MFKRKYSNEEKRESESFMSGVLVLSVSSIIVKMIGLAYKIPMISYLGAEGMGYFNSAYEIYALLCVISTAGLPVALSILVSASLEQGDWLEIRSLKRSAIGLFFIVGGVGSAFMILFSHNIADWIGNRDARLCIIAIAPSLLFVCVSSALRGYFQGLRQMSPTAVSQLIEALGKLVLGIIFAIWGLEQGWELPAVSAAAIAGISLGTMLSTLYLWCVYSFRKQKKPMSVTKKKEYHNGRRSLALLVRIAVPITLSAALLGITRLFDMALIMKRLQFQGMSSQEANRIYGAYTTMAVPIFSLVPTLITPIALALVPQLSAAIEGKAKDRQNLMVERAIMLTTFFSIPAGIGVSVYAQNIIQLLFPTEEAAATIAAPLLSMLGPSIFFSGMITTTNAMLQSFRKEKMTIVSMAIGACVKMASAYILIGSPMIGALGAPISTFLCNGIIMLLNLFYLRKCFAGNQIPMNMSRVFYKPLFCASVANIASIPVYIGVMKLTGQMTVAFLSAVVVIGVLYFIFVFLLKIVTKDDLLCFSRKKVNE